MADLLGGYRAGPDFFNSVWPKISRAHQRVPASPKCLNSAGYEVWATDGEIGQVEGFVMDDASWHLAYLVVKAGGWLLSRSVLVPTLWVNSVSWADHRVNLHHTQKRI